MNTSTWGIEDTIITINKTVDFGVVHDYLELYNNSGDSLVMRWVCHEPVTWPAQWETDFTDPDSNFYDVQDLDSHDFVLPYPVGFSNKLIIGVDHSLYIHTDTISFKVWPLLHPEDSLWVHYVIIINPSGTGIAEEEQHFNAYQINESQIYIEWDRSGEVSIIDLSGREVYRLNEINLIGGTQIDLGDLPRQVYIVNVSDFDGTRKSFKIALH